METKNIEEKEKKQEKTPKTTKEKVIFGLKIAGNVIFYAILVVLMLISIANIASGGKDGLPQIFGKGYLSVQSNSMNADVSVITSDVTEEYTDSQKSYLEKNGLLNSDGKYELDYSKFKIGKFDDHDMVVVDILSDKEKKNLKVGDVVTYYDSVQKMIISHRIVYVSVDSEGNAVSYTTMGDLVVSQYSTVWSGTTWGKQHYQEYIFNQCYTLTADDTALYGKVTSVIGGAGDVADNIKQYWLFYIVLPIAILLVVEIFFVFKNVIDYRNEKKGITKDGKVVASAAIDLEAEREKMKQELLAELKASQQQDTNKEDIKDETKSEDKADTETKEE